MPVTTLKQEQRVLNILLNTGQVDNFYCINNRITTRLGAYIYNLRNKGYVIETTRNKETKNTHYILRSVPKHLRKAV